MKKSTPLGTTLSVERRAKGLSQRGLSTAAGIGWVCIANIERGATRSPKVETLRALANALRIPLSKLVSRVA